MDCLSVLLKCFLIYSAQDPSPWDTAVPIQGGSFCPRPFWKGPHRVTRSCVSMVIPNPIRSTMLLNCHCLAARDSETLTLSSPAPPFCLTGASRDGTRKGVCWCAQEVFQYSCEGEVTGKTGASSQGRESQPGASSVPSVFPCSLSRGLLRTHCVLVYPRLYEKTMIPALPPQT